MDNNDNFIIDHHRYIRWLLYMAIIITIVYMLMLPAEAYTDQQAVQTIVGEASNQGFKGMVCVGEVIRHNSSLNGFYGLKAMNHRHEPVWVWKQARKAWQASLKSNYTGGANHFENITAFGEPYWVKRCKLTFIYKDHKFYREMR